MAVIAVGVCGIYNDDGVYVTTAKALAEGHGYRLINLPGEPFETKFPLLYPAALSVIWRLWPAYPANLLALQGLSVLLSACVIGCGFVYAVRIQRLSALVAGAGLAACATSPVFAYFSTQTLSEIPFALSLIGVLWLVGHELENSDADEQTNAHRCRIGLAIAVPCLIRLIGCALVIPMLWTLWRRQKRLAWYAAGVGIPLVFWYGWIAIARHDTEFARAALNSPDSWDWWRHIAWRAPAAVVRYNALMTSVATADFFPVLWKRHVALAFPLIGVLIWASVVRRGRSGLALALMAYIGIVLVWPWPSARFLVPIWPLLAPFAFEPVYRRFGVAATAVFAAVAIGGNLLALRESAASTRSVHYPTVPLAIQQPPAARWSTYERLFAWTRSHTDPHDLLAADMDSMVFLYTGRQTVRPFDIDPLALFYGVNDEAVGTREKLARSFKRLGARYLIRTPMVGFGEDRPFAELLERTREYSPRCLSEIYFDPEDARFRVYLIAPLYCQE